MKIVIDISEEEYNLIKMKSELNIGGVSSEAEQAIAKGKPLSEYMKTLRLHILHDFYEVKPKYWYTACTQIEKSIKEFMDNDYRYERKEKGE